MPLHKRALAAVSVLSAPLLLALVGGWATITVDDLPDYLTAGKSETMSFTVRQHGIEPLRGLSPRVEARNGRTLVAAPARATAVPGRYEAVVTVPEAGAWSITIESSFGPSRLVLPPTQALAVGAPTPAPMTPADRGKRLFVAKGCVGCHVHGDVAYPAKPWDTGAPDLTGRTYPAALLAQQLTDPAGAARAQRKEGRMPSLGLSTVEVSQITAFINRQVVGTR